MTGILRGQEKDQLGHLLRSGLVAEWDDGFEVLAGAQPVELLEHLWSRSVPGCTELTRMWYSASSRADALGHAPDGPFAGSVGERGGCAPKPGDRRDVDDRSSAALLDHHRGDGLHAEEHAGLVDLGDPAVLLERGVEHLQHPEDAGVVDQHVDVAELLAAGVDDGGPVRFAGHVVMAVDGRVAEVLGDGLALLVEHVAEDDLGAFGDEQPGFGFSLTSGRSADQGHFAGQPAGRRFGHGGTLTRVCDGVTGDRWLARLASRREVDNDAGSTQGRNYMGSQIELGDIMLTFVEPHRDGLLEYNRWYEHDHAYAAVSNAPGCFAYRRFVATAPLKALRYPADSAVVQPVEKGSFISLFWFEKDRVADVFEYSFGITPAARSRTGG